MIASVRDGAVSPGRSSVPSSSTVTGPPAGGGAGVAVTGGTVGSGVALGRGSVAVGGGWVGAGATVGSIGKVGAGAAIAAGCSVAALAVATIIAWTLRWMLKSD